MRTLPAAAAWHRKDGRCAFTERAPRQREGPETFQGASGPFVREPIRCVMTQPLGSGLNGGAARDQRARTKWLICRLPSR